MTVEIVTQTAQSVFIKLFGKKCKGGDITFTAMMAFAALIFFALMSIGAPYSLEVVPYSALYAVCYALATLTYILAFGCGSLGITALIISYSLVVPTLYGLIFWNESLGIVRIIGIAALLISLFLVRERSDGDKKAITLKWTVYMSISFITNGACAVIQREQQIKFAEKYDMSFMVMALAVATVIMFIAAAVIERGTLLESIKRGAMLSFLSGAANGTANLFIMLSLAVIPASQFFPIIAAGQTILTFVVSMIMFGERFIPRQWVGIAFGTAALVLMNM